MTINKVVARVSALKPSPFDDSMIASWLYELEGKLAIEVMGIEPPAPVMPEEAGGREPGAPGPEGWDKPLLAPYPYDNIYELYALSMIDWYLREYDQYQNSMEAFQSAWKDCTAWYIRGHRPPARYYENL